MMNNRLSVMLVIIGAAIPSASHAAGTRLTFVASDTTPQSVGVLSELYRRESNGAPIRVSPGGQAAMTFSFEESDCKPTVQFTVTPVVGWLYTYSQEDWRSCQPDFSYQFSFTPNLSLSKSKALYALVGSAAPALGELTRTQADILSAALDKQDFGTISFLSTELKTAYVAAGKVDLANQWSNVAVAAGWEAVTAQASTASVEQPFQFDKDALRYTPEALSVIKKYQADIGIVADGKLNWPTMRSLSELANSDIYSLSNQRIEILAPVSDFR